MTIVEKWLEFVRRDLEAAKILFKNGDKMGFAYQASVFHCHQAVEKLLKACIVKNGEPVVKTHDFVRLEKLAGIRLGASLSRFIRDINPHYQLTRYPDMPFVSDFSFTYKKASAGKILSKTKKLYLCLEKKLMQNL